jgi:very-short-patch-repair endonuclease
MTPAEKALWQALRRKELGGRKFRRQHPLGPFIVDFYCVQSRLAIELDGPVHDAQIEPDEARTAYLTELGYRVLRFRNEDVLERLETVLQAIGDACNIGPLPPPPPNGEGRQTTKRVR